jgi:uncharacterized DUF497 family protein
MGQKPGFCLYGLIPKQPPILKITGQTSNDPDKPRKKGYSIRRIIPIMDFEWYSEKERQNVEKHGIDLETVKRVFDDPFRIEQYDESHSGMEDRWQVLGKAGGVLFVVYSERGVATRIITAREAEPEERQIYYGENSKGNWFIP